jgi:hypothetical protein
VKRINVVALRHAAWSTANVSRLAAFLIVLCTVLVAQLVSAAPADLDLNMIAYDRIIQGAQVPIYTDVYNVAAPGSDNLDYSLYYTFPNGSTSSVLTGSRAADGGAGVDRWTYNFNSALAPYGANTFKSTVEGQAGTLHSPKQYQVNIQVLNHVVPAQWYNGVEVDIREDHPPAQEPSPDPLAFGATGGGETVSLAAPNVLGDPLVPTANMDLDSISEIGSSKITSDLVPTYGVVADDSPTAGIDWSIIVNRSQPGHFEKTFTLKFSDEDIPGGSSPESMTARLFVYFDIAADGSGVGGIVPLYVPEPGVASMLVALSALLLRRRRIG